MILFDWIAYETFLSEVYQKDDLYLSSMRDSKNYKQEKEHDQGRNLNIFDPAKLKSKDIVKAYIKFM